MRRHKGRDVRRSVDGRRRRKLVSINGKGDCLFHDDGTQLERLHDHTCPTSYCPWMSGAPLLRGTGKWERFQVSWDQNCLGRHDEHTTTTYTALRHRTAVSYIPFFERVHEACRYISSLGGSPLFELLYKSRNLVNDLDSQIIKSKLEPKRYIIVPPNTGHQVLLGRSINGVYTIKTCCLCPCFSIPVIKN